jgi:hypothetical protein
MNCTIPSLVPIPSRSYGELSLAGIAACFALVASGLLYIASLSIVHRARLMEVAHAPVDLQLQEVAATLAQCDKSLSLGEKLLSRRKMNSHSFREPAVVLDSLQRVLPDDAWIDSFYVSQGSVELVVKASSERTSVHVVDHIKDTAKLSAARVDSVELVPGDGMGVYTLSIKAKTDRSHNVDVGMKHHESP